MYKMIFSVKTLFSVFALLFSVYACNTIVSHAEDTKRIGDYVTVPDNIVYTISPQNTVTYAVLPNPKSMIIPKFQCEISALGGESGGIFVVNAHNYFPYEGYNGNQIGKATIDTITFKYHGDMLTPKGNYAFFQFFNNDYLKYIAVRCKYLTNE